MADCKCWSGRRIAGAAAIVAFFAALQGCAVPVVSEMTAFHQWPAQAPRTYRLAVAPEQLESLEQGSYRSLLREELARAGFSETSSPRFEITFQTSVRSRAERVVAYPGPVVQPWFFWGAAGSGGGAAITAPWPGIGWSAPPVVSDRLIHDYSLSINFRDLADAGRRVYEAQVVSSGTQPSIVSAMPYLIRSIFVDFPGLSGVPRRVELPVER
jgi:hypothetical protein